MPGKSHAYSNAVLNVLNGNNLPGVTPFIALFSVAPGDDGSAGTELSGNGYSRQAIITPSSGRSGWLAIRSRRAHGPRAILTFRPPMRRTPLPGPQFGCPLAQQVSLIPSQTTLLQWAAARMSAHSLSRWRTVSSTRANFPNGRLFSAGAFIGKTKR